MTEIYGETVSRDTVSRIAYRVIEDVQAWSAGALGSFAGAARPAP